MIFCRSLSGFRDIGVSVQFVYLACNYSLQCLHSIVRKYRWIMDYQ